MKREALFCFHQLLTEGSYLLALRLSVIFIRKSLVGYWYRHMGQKDFISRGAARQIKAVINLLQSFFISNGCLLVLQRSHACFPNALNHISTGLLIA